ncbi:MAG: FKBP-type peptidyl-prolyl cis-trans isomerase [Planctomycetes bacterium]|nr:FKBP-type peptidyl-prolyl cis-trans isomerase [Planctomycetota bacterium]
MRIRRFAPAALVLLLWSCKPSDPNQASPPAGDAAAPAGRDEKVAPPADAAPAAAPAESVSTPPAPASQRLDPLVPQGKTGDPAARPGLKSTPSGLQYAVLQQGEGATPEPGRRARIHITGWIRVRDALGPQIVDSRESKIPKEFALTPTDLVAGLLEAILDMRAGERRWVIVPSKLGYGLSGYGRTVPPNQDLVFDVELVDFR